MMPSSAALQITKADYNPMTTTNDQYAVDLSNDGVMLWHRDADQPWQLLDEVALDAQDFSERIEQLKIKHGPNAGDRYLTRVRIPQSEVYISEIDLNGLDCADNTPKINDFLAQNTPYEPQELSFDLCNKADVGATYVAAITKQTIKEAKEFISGFGFEVAFYTTKLDGSDFTKNPRFYDSEPPAPVVDIDANVTEKIPPKEIPEPPPPVSSALKAGKIKKTKSIAADEVVSLEKLATKNDDTPNVDDSGKDLNAFATKRSKDLVADVRSSDHPPSPAKQSTLVPPPPRISIDLPRTNTTTPVIGPIKTPQGDTAKTDTSRFFNMRNVIIIAAIGLIALLYWFFSVMFDGKEEISLIQKIPETEPFVITEPQSLKYQVSSDASPSFVQNDNKKNTHKPQAQIPISLIEPTLDNVNQDIDKTAVTQKPPKIDTPTLVDIIAKQEKLAETLSKNNSSTNESNPVNITTEAAPDPVTEIPTQIADVITPDQTKPVIGEVAKPNLLLLADPALKSILPKFRPPSISEKAKASRNSLLALADPTLASSKPKRRPANLSVPNVKINPLEIEVAIQQAVRETNRPRSRPKSLSRTVARANKNSETVQTSALVEASPANAANGTSKASGPSPANIQKEATERSKVSKNHMFLIGVFGKPSDRHALLRMPSGRFVKVKPGQKVGGWKVAAIGESSVRIIKGNRNQVLRMPK
jgi:type IV pilus biogenesis protein PilP